MKFGEVLILVIALIGLCVLVLKLVRAFNPRVMNKAGPDWRWRAGKHDPVRNVFFREDGSFRRYGRLAFVALLLLGVLAAISFFWTLY